MRGVDQQQVTMVRYISAEVRIPTTHPFRTIRGMADTAAAEAISPRGVCHAVASRAVSRAMASGPLSSRIAERSRQFRSRSRSAPGAKDSVGSTSDSRSVPRSGRPRPHPLRARGDPRCARACRRRSCSHSGCRARPIRRSTASHQTAPGFHFVGTVGAAGGRGALAWHARAARLPARLESARSGPRAGAGCS